MSNARSPLFTALGIGLDSISAMMTAPRRSGPLTPPARLPSALERWDDLVPTGCTTAFPRRGPSFSAFSQFPQFVALRLDELNHLMTEHPTLTRLKASRITSITELWFDPSRPEDFCFRGAQRSHVVR
jgi:hypothetical protein